MDYTKLPFVQARWYTKRDVQRDVRFVVIHTIECAETPLAAENCARYFQTTNNKVSAHYCVDNNSIVQCLQTKDIAWAARSVGNRYGVHLEHGGRAAQAAEQWADAYSEAMLKISAGLTAFLCQKFGLPIAWLNAKALRAGGKGITGHADITLAWGGTHYDPGPSFPVARYLDYVRAAMT